MANLTPEGLHIPAVTLTDTPLLVFMFDTYRISKPKR
jgi:hypothetical protein